MARVRLIVHGLECLSLEPRKSLEQKKKNQLAKTTRPLVHNSVSQ